MQCGDCAHVFTSGYFTEATLSLIFSGTNESQQPGYNFEGQRPVSARIVERVSRYKNSGTWLDVGCGNGSLLFTAEEWGYRPVGLDLRESTVRGLVALGIETHALTIEAYKTDDRVDVISMADSLEHMVYPRLALAAATSLLARDGVLFLSMPHYGCATWRLLDMQNANPYWGELEHYHNFSRDRLAELLSEFGFFVAEYSVSERYRACMQIVAIRSGVGS